MYVRFFHLLEPVFNDTCLFDRVLLQKMNYKGAVKNGPFFC